MSRRIITLNEFLNEGGWSSVKTQETKLTPKILKLVDDQIKMFDKEFNKHLDSAGLPDLKFIKAIGSGSWYEDDMINQPDKLYGDIDYLVSYPLLQIEGAGTRKDEVESIKTYNAELFRFLELANLSYVDREETLGMSSLSSVKILFRIEDDGVEKFVQADMVITHPPYEEWALDRYTPIRDVKGFVIGNMYTALATTLGLSIQDRGVRGKFKGSVLSPWSKRTGVEEKVISLDFNNFLHDIASFFFEYLKKEGDMKPSKGLEKYKGVDVKGLDMPRMVDAIRGLAVTLEDNNLLGDVIKWRNKEEFMDNVYYEYHKSMMKAFNAPKFNKASTPAAHAAVKKIRNLIDTYIKMVDDLT
jgi:hypothetical protein